MSIRQFSIALELFLYDECFIITLKGIDMPVLFKDRIVLLALLSIKNQILHKLNGKEYQIIYLLTSDSTPI
ncbi:hypothetical protein EUGRSUZ_I00347 [Eucalyptus grandis]|uniref:Uncharacterized protein n=2 Tax=Eucalyptus grandis TaxID=71139 RepID=A0ACC3JBX4_EUCGR|nr:hypothetical protein EUGRSUZ_I00347 [Eucalyptus grandis]